MAIAASKWIPVQLDGAIFSNPIVDGLIGIEECTDYNLDIIGSSERKRKKVKSSNKNRKKVKTKDEDNENSENKAISIESENKSMHTPSKSGSTLENEEESQSESGSIEDKANLKTLNAWESYFLPNSILKSLQEHGFEQPTEIQAFTLPSAILGKRDILGAAETGSGKTLAFGLPILTGILQLKEKSDKKKNPEESDDGSDLDSISNSELKDIGLVKSYKINENKIKKPLYALILTPTRELAIQVKNHLISIAKYTGINIAVVVGGMAAVKQERLLSRGPEIVIGTPGRLWELLQQGNEHLSQIDKIRFLAIDETDRMLEKGHFQELHELLERLNMSEKNKKARQNFVFSATLTLIHDIPTHLVNKRKVKGRNLSDMTTEQKLQKIVDTLGVTNPKIVDLSQGTGTSGTLTECRLTCAIDEKDHYVYYFLKKHPGRTLIFCNSIGCVKRLTALLALLDCDPLPLHASMQQRQRLKNLERFRDTENSILIATDVAARGLDIPRIDHVLHYQTPRTSESYVHRSGRTARASKQGITVLIMEPNEFTNYLKLCKTLGKNEDLPIFPVQEKYLNAVKQRVNLAVDLDKLQLQVRKANSEEGWLQKAAKEMDIIVDGISKKYDNEETRSIKKQAEFKRKQLATLLATPIFPTGFSGKFPLLEYSGNTVFQAASAEEKAIDVMKNAMKPNLKIKSKHIPLYKSKKAEKHKNERMVIIKLNKFKKSKNMQKNQQLKKKRRN